MQHFLSLSHITHSFSLTLFSFIFVCYRFCLVWFIARNWTWFYSIITKCGSYFWIRRNLERNIGRRSQRRSTLYHSTTNFTNFSSVSSHSRYGKLAPFSHETGSRFPAKIYSLFDWSFTDWKHFFVSLFWWTRILSIVFFLQFGCNWTRHVLFFLVSSFFLLLRMLLNAIECWQWRCYCHFYWGFRSKWVIKNVINSGLVPLIFLVQRMKHWSQISFDIFVECIIRPIKFCVQILFLVGLSLVGSSNQWRLSFLKS